jgi:hypothetical protein
MLVRPEVLPYLVRATAVQANRKVWKHNCYIFFIIFHRFALCCRFVLRRWTSSSRSQLGSSSYKSFTSDITSLLRRCVVDFSDNPATASMRVCTYSLTHASPDTCCFRICLASFSQTLFQTFQLQTRLYLIMTKVTSKNKLVWKFMISARSFLWHRPVHHQKSKNAPLGTLRACKWLHLHLTSGSFSSFHDLFHFSTNILFTFQPTSSKRIGSSLS